MSGCGYVCPKCEGKGSLDDGSRCDWCAEEPVSENNSTEPDVKNQLSDEDWLKETHEGKCCAD